MDLDVIVPTYNRAPLLERAVRSLAETARPEGLRVTITVVDNRCTDGTGTLLARLARDYPGQLRILYERRRSKSRSLNLAIRASTAELIGMIDDDEEIHPCWFHEVFAAFQDESLEFIGGPYVPLWSSAPPAWLPLEYLAVVGAVDNGCEPLDYSPSFPGILKGGNAVIRRRTLLAAGPYAEFLGPSDTARLLSCEDEDMYLRLLKGGARGRYLPSLVIYHHVPIERLSPEYYRRWCFWRGISRGLMDRSHRLPVPYLGGVPRFLYGRAARGLLRVVKNKLHREGWEGAFSDELSVWDLAGFFWGRHIYTLARFSPVRSRRRARHLAIKSSPTND
jgi:glycosyltransferase involved in cell wall biosynthesis